MEGRVRTENLDLDKLFGKDRAQEDENLGKYFVKTRQYNEIVSGTKELVLGRKGSGKSALFSYLTKEFKKEGKIPISISLKGEDFVKIFDAILKYKDLNLDDDFKFALVWRDFILTEIAYTTVNTIGESSHILIKHLKKNGKIEKDFVNKYVNSLLKIFGKGKINTELIEFNFDLSNLSMSSNVIEQEIKECISKSIFQNNFYVMFDNLDEPWKNSIEMNFWLRGLVLAMRQLKRDFNNLKLICFLRDDIYDEISKGSDLFDSQSEIIKLKWRDNNNYSLRKLIATRIAVYFNKNIPVVPKEFNELWKLLYPEKVSYATKYGKKQQYTNAYIIDRTFARPREFLQFCRLIVEKSQSNYIPVEKDAVFAADKEFCDWKVRDLEGEFSKTYSNISRCIFSFANVSDNWQFSYEIILKHLNSLSNEEKIYYIPENKNLNPEEALCFLYKIGFLRKKKGKRFITSAEESYINQKISTFDIHPAFRRKLISI